MRRLDIISDVICPWCWIAKAQLDLALSEVPPVEVHWRPFQLNPDMPAEGMPRAEYRARKFGARAAQLDAQLTEVGRANGLQFRFDRVARTPNTLAAHALLRAASGPAQHALAEALFRAYFHDGQDLGDDAVLGGFGVVDLTLQAEAAAEDAAFRAMGISAVPTFALDGVVLISGAVGTEQMVAALA